MTGNSDFDEFSLFRKDGKSFPQAKTRVFFASVIGRLKSYLDITHPHWCINATLNLRNLFLAYRPTPAT